MTQVLPPPEAPSGSLAEKAYYSIRDMIVSLELPPGAILHEAKLMEQLGVGRTPVREAVRMLAQAKLVEVFPRRGVFVTTVNIRDLASLSEVREVLEGHAARLAAERATEEDQRELAALIDECGRKDALDRPGLIDLDQRIHRHVYRCTHNGFLEATLDEYYVLALRIWFLALERVARLDEAVREHQELLEAIRDRDADRAEQAMRRHVQGFEQAIRAVL
ncbi:MAG TPA: GntR family transcriptional regulator [Gaiellaceae bacterium]|nr:GntR family transcriptional regulator [Gaiellaceae bacterium]